MQAPHHCNFVRSEHGKRRPQALHVGLREE